MISKRAKLTTTVTFAGLGALAGIATATNHGMPPTTVATANGHEVVTRASGAASAGRQAATPAGHAPIVTRSSGAAAVGPGAVDD